MTTRPSDGRHTGDEFDRLERSVEQQAAAITRQQQTLTTLAEALARVEAQVERLAKGAADQGDDLDHRLEQVSLALKRATAADKRIVDHVYSVGEQLKRSISIDKRTIERIDGISEQMKRVLVRLAKVGAAFDPSVDDAFVAVVQPLVEERRTMLGYDRLFSLWQAARNAAALGLPAVEVGTFRGGSAALVARALSIHGGTALDVHVVDTFEGHLDDTFTDHDPDQQRGKFKEVTVDDVRQFLSAYPGVHVYQGDGPTVVRGWPERRYGMVHLDMDLYQPTLDCLRYFSPLMAPGGIIVVDDYEAPTCPGVAVAVHEHLAACHDFQIWRLQVEQVVLIRR